MALSKLIEIFIEFLDDKDSSPHTIRNYKGTLVDFTRYLEEEIFNGIAILENFTIEHLQEYMSYRKKRGNSGKTRANVLVTLRSFWNFLVKRGFTQANLASQLDNIHVQKKERLYLTISEMKHFLSVIDKPVIYAACSTICFMGLRISELCSLKLDDVNFDRNEITVVCGKGKKDRVIPMNPEIKQILTKYKKQFRNNNSDNFFSTMNSGKLTHQYLNECIHAYAKKAGLNPKLSAHCLRHSFASALVAQNCPIPVLQRLLGHADLKSSSIYLHTEQSQLIESVNTLSLKKRR